MALLAFFQSRTNVILFLSFILSRHFSFSWVDQQSLMAHLINRSVPRGRQNTPPSSNFLAILEKWISGRAVLNYSWKRVIFIEEDCVEC